MKNWKRLLALFLSGAMALSLCACKPDDGADNPDPSADASEGSESDAAPEIEVDLTQSALEFAVGLSPTDILLTINGEDIQADLFCYMLGQACIQNQQYLSYFGASLADMPDMAEDLLEQGVNLLLYHILIQQKAAELGCLLTDDQSAEVQLAMDNANLEVTAPYWDLTDEGIRFIFELEYYYENVLDAVTSEPDGQEFDEYLTSEGVFSVKHILLMTSDDQNEPLPDDEIAAKRALAEDLLAQLQAAEDMPAKFDELMNEYSEDSGLQTNPEGYLFTSQDSLVGGFREAALELEEGGLSGIVETDYGYHIMLRLPLTDEQAETYKNYYRQDALADQMDQWMEAAEVVRSDALSSLNAVDFYARLDAYQQALSAQQQDDAAADGSGVDDGDAVG